MDTLTRVQTLVFGKPYPGGVDSRTLKEFYLVLRGRGTSKPELRAEGQSSFLDFGESPHVFVPPLLQWMGQYSHHE